MDEKERIPENLTTEEKLRYLKKQEKRKAIWGIIIGIVPLLALMIGLCVGIDYVSENALPILLVVLVAVGAISGYLFLAIYEIHVRHREKVIAETGRDEKAEAAEQLNQEIAAHYGYGERSLLLIGSVSGKMYQLIRDDKFLYFVYIGSLFKGFNTELAITDFSQKDLFLTHKRSFSVALDEVSQVTFVKQTQIINAVTYEGTLCLDSGASKRKFLYRSVKNSENEISNFFAGLPLSYTDKSKPAKAAEELPEESLPTAYRLRLVSYVLTSIDMIMAVAFLVLHVNYSVQSALLMAAFFLAFALYLWFGRVTTMNPVRTIGRKERVSLFFPFSIPAVALTARCLLDFHVIGWKNLFLFSAIFVVILTVLFLTLSQELRKNRKVIANALICFLIFAPGFTLQLNYIGDRSEPTVEYAEVLALSGPESDCYVTVEYKGRVRKVKTSQEVYETLLEGDYVSVWEVRGLFGIPLIFIDEA